jgi:hypothetical protein
VCFFSLEFGIFSNFATPNENHATLEILSHIITQETPPTNFTTPESTRDKRHIHFFGCATIFAVDCTSESPSTQLQGRGLANVPESDPEGSRESLKKL